MSKKEFCELFSKLFSLMCEKNHEDEDFRTYYHQILGLLDLYTNSHVIDKDPLRIMIAKLKNKTDDYKNNSLTHSQILKDMSPLFIEIRKYLDSFKRY
ncbi:MAG TPA: hypothetical protein V6C58_25610 [Allocoleopsis sp.]